MTLRHDYLRVTIIFLKKNNLSWDLYNVNNKQNTIVKVWKFFRLAKIWMIPRPVTSWENNEYRSVIGRRKEMLKK